MLVSKNTTRNNSPGDDGRSGELRLGIVEPGGHGGFLGWRRFSAGGSWWVDRIRILTGRNSLNMGLRSF